MFRSSLASIRTIVLGSAIGLALIATPALAAKDKHEHGRGNDHGSHHEHGRGNGHGNAPEIEVKDNGKEYRYEYKDRGCHYEYKLDYRTGEEKIKQKGNCRGVSPRRALYPVSGPVVYDERGHDREEPVRTGSRIACNRDVIGAVLGGIAGGIAGSNVGHGDGRKVATVAGAIIGAVIGGNIGRNMDRADEGCAYQALEFASPGETVFWRNPQSNLEYAITPAQLTRHDGRECREYKTTVLGGNVSQKGASGFACRNSNGAWEIR
jgi:surface antigen